MTNEEIKSALLSAQTALVEKLGKQPYVQISLILSDSWVVEGALTGGTGSWEWIRSGFHETPDEALDGIMRAIEKLPSVETRNLRKYQAKVAEVIDLGNELGIDQEWLNPIVATARKLAENALTYEASK